MKILNTRQIINLAKNYPKKVLEIQLILNNNFFATHFLIYIKNNKILDEGIDGEIREMTIDDFLSHYYEAKWGLFQIV